MSKWSFLFLSVPIVGVGIFAVADRYGLGLPENVSTIGRDIDHLYYLILAITGVVFIATQLVLCYILFKFSSSKKNGRRATYVHGSRMWEIWWTIIPALALLFIALYQLSTWIKFRFPQSKPNRPPLARVLGRQFEWRIAYPGPDGVLDTIDDIHVPNELHIPMSREVLVEIQSMDVLHSFFLPHLRVKQDLVPGMTIPVWFDANKSTRQFRSEHAALKRKDLLEPDALVDKLLSETQPGTVGAYVRSWLPEATVAELDEYDPSFEPSRGLIDKLVAGLNRVIDKEETPKDRFYTPERFGGVELSAETAAHVARPSGGIYRPLLNRQLLQDAFPGVFRDLDGNFDLVCAELCGWGHYKMKGRLVVHETKDEFDRWLEERRVEQEASR